MATLHFGNQVLDSTAFSAGVERCARALWQLGLRPGDVVALMLHNEPLAVQLALAARRLGLPWCPINWHFRQDEVRHILEDSGATVLVVHRPLLVQIQGGIPPQVRVFTASLSPTAAQAHGLSDTESPGSWNDWIARTPEGLELPTPALGSMMVYTSGTTGKPKGVRRAAMQPEQAQTFARITQAALGITDGMRALLSAPLYHSAPGSYMIQAMARPAEVWLEPRFDAERTLAMIEEHQITHAYVVPTMAKRLLDLPASVRQRYSVKSLSFVVSTGAPFPPDVKAALMAWWGPVIHESYAATELGWITHINSQDAIRKPGSVGRALSGARLRILDIEGHELPAGKVGAIYARLDAIPDFTYNNLPSARSAIEHDGLLSLGDMGYLDEEGFLYITGRYSDMVISGGVNIYPAEIEAVLMTLPGVADCAVFGIPDPDFGEALLAVVQPASTAILSDTEIQDYLRQRLASYKVPRKVLLRNDLPREDTGKIFKRKLREPYWNRDANLA